MSHTGSHPAEEDKDYEYAHDDTHNSQPSSRERQSPKSNQDDPITTCDRVTNILAIGLLFLILLTSIISIAAGAACLASLSGQPFHHFSLFFAFGVTPVVLGIICLIVVALVLVFIIFFAMGVKRYGMCCLAESCGMKALNICLYAVFPFIVFLLMLAMCICGFSFYSLSRQIPSLDKDYTSVEGLNGTAHIMRDENGLVHIKAGSRRDAYVAQGFAEAQDRLFQIEYNRLVAQGRLSEYVGGAGEETDIAMRTLNVRDAATSLYNLASDEDKDYLEAFAEGLNLYLSRESKRPVEFFFMSKRPLYFHNPEPFVAADICTSARLLQFKMSYNLASEGQRFEVWMAGKRNYSLISELYNDYSKVKYPILTQAQVGTSAAEMATNLQKYELTVGTEAVFLDTMQSVLEKLMGILTGGVGATAAAQQAVEESTSAAMTKFHHQRAADTFFAMKYVHASNAWSARDASNHALAASDPHLPLNMPSVWYYAHLSFPAADGTQYDAAGVGMVGLPGVHIARTTYVSWGITMSLTDLEDLIVFAPGILSLKSNNQYQYKGVWRKFTTRQEKILVKGHKDIDLEVEDSVVGPIVTDMVKISLPIKVALFASFLRHHDNSSVHALMATTDPEVTDAEMLMNRLLEMQSPGFSIPIADAKGGIAYVMTGRHPNRTVGHTGKFPLLCFLREGKFSFNCDTYASDSPDVDDDMIPMTDNPHYYSAPDGKIAYLASSNQLPAPLGSYGHIFGFDYVWGYRSQRIIELLKEKESTIGELETHRAIQLDLHSNIWANEIRPIVANSTFQDLIKDDAAAKKWSDRLLAWDMNTNIGSTEAAFFWRWMQRMTVLPRDAAAAIGAERWPVLLRYVPRMLMAPTPNMTLECQEAGKVAGCLEFAAMEFKAQAAVGHEDKWGIDMNHLEATHEYFHGKLEGPVFDRTIEGNGDITSIAVSDFSMDGDFHSTQASSMRQLYDMGAGVEHVELSLPGGASGNPYSKYYQNLWELYSQRKYVTVAATATSLANMTVAHSQKLSK